MKTPMNLNFGSKVPSNTASSPDIRDDTGSSLGISSTEELPFSPMLERKDLSGQDLDLTGMEEFYLTEIESMQNNDQIVKLKKKENEIMQKIKEQETKISDLKAQGVSMLETKMLIQSESLKTMKEVLFEINKKLQQFAFNFNLQDTSMLAIMERIEEENKTGVSLDESVSVDISMSLDDDPVKITGTKSINVIGKSDVALERSYQLQSSLPWKQTSMAKDEESIVFDDSDEVDISQVSILIKASSLPVQHEEEKQASI